MRLPVRASISTTRAQAKMPSLPRMWPRMVRPPLDSPPSSALCCDHAGGDVLEPDRHLVALLAELRGQPVEQVGGGQVADHSAALAAHLVEIPVHEQQEIVGGDVSPRFVDDGDAVGVAIGGEAEVVMALFPCR